VSTCGVKVVPMVVTCSTSLAGLSNISCVLPAVDIAVNLHDVVYSLFKTFDCCVSLPITLFVLVTVDKVVIVAECLQ